MSETADPTNPADTPAPGPFSRRTYEMLRHGPLGRYMAGEAIWQAALALAALAVGTSFNYALANTTVQERAPGPIRGRVSALAMLSFVGVMPFSSLLVTELADLTSIRLAMTVCAVAYGVVSFVLFAGPGRNCGDLPLPQTIAVPVEA